MATLEYDVVARRYRIRFSFGGRPFKRSLKTQDEAEARAAVTRVEETIRLIDRGRLEIPPDADPATFILSDGKLNSKPKLPEVLTLHKLFSLYRNGVPEGAKEANTRTTEKLHCKHWERILGSHKAVQAITVADVQQYADKRARETGILDDLAELALPLKRLANSEKAS
ncbi:hypothetical protein AYO44_12305 [Planctomycetaceae bacterium SCGC AG-212-F19]|nr:hypothetical protein AYO44_12305 [Planctomycetaceae bacterium SCGC AG-212-F19]